MLLDFLDEDEDEMIKKDVVMKIIVSSFVQNMEGHFRASEIVNRLFTDLNGELTFIMNKIKLWNTIMERTKIRKGYKVDENILNDTLLEPFFMTLL